MVLWSSHPGDGLLRNAGHRIILKSFKLHFDTVWPQRGVFLLILKIYCLHYSLVITFLPQLRIIITFYLPTWHSEKFNSAALMGLWSRQICFRSTVSNWLTCRKIFMLKHVSCVAWNHLEKRELNVGTIQAVEICWDFIFIIYIVWYFIMDSRIYPNEYRVSF